MNKIIFVSCGDSKWSSRSGQAVEVLHQLTPDKVDDEVGAMFRVRFSDGVETDAFLDELPELAKYRFGEVVFDITTCAAAMVHEYSDSRMIEEYDSRDLYACVFVWAREFERKYPWTGFDYLILIEEFARAKLREYFELEE